MINDLLTLAMLIFLQAVLGFDNLLYISLESKRAPEDKRQFVRRWGIGLAIALRIVLLFALVKAISSFQTVFWSPSSSAFAAEFNIHSLIVLGGGVFIMHTAVKEISHMLVIDDLETQGEEEEPRSVAQVIGMILLMNLVFSFDSILGAIALTDTFWVMATAIVISGILMIVLADTVADFLQKNRLYEVLGLFVLLIVGVMLLSEGGHLAKMEFFGYHVEVMSKTTFYFSIGVLVLVDLVQSRYQKKLNLERERQKQVAAEKAATE